MAAIPFLEEIVSRGICTPGLGMTFLFFFLPITVVLLVIVNLIRIFTYRKEHTYSLLLHVLVLLSGFVFVKFFLTE